MKNFDIWFKTCRDSIYTYDFFTDFTKVYDNINNITNELNKLNSLIGSQNIERDFTNIVTQYPETLQCIPVLLANRQQEIIVNDTIGKHIINFKKFKNTDIELYIKFMQETGLFDLLANSKIKSLQDYVTGVEVGLDSNARKNRTGKTMENFVENYIQNAGYKKDETYFTQVNAVDFDEKFNIDLTSYIRKNANKKFDFVIKKGSKIYAIEVNFYNTGGSKLNETAKSYQSIAKKTKKIRDFQYMWITDGKGWQYSKQTLKTIYNNIKCIYNLKDVENGLFNNL